MSLLKRIRDAAVTEETPLADLLRMCKVLGASLENERLQTWAHQELNGYQNRSDLPPYRVFRTRVLARLRNPVGIHTTPVGQSVIDEILGEEKGKSWSTAFVMLGVAELAMVPKDENLQYPWPPEYFRLLRPHITGAAIAEAVWMQVPRTKVGGILDAVRNRVLDLALELCKEDPELAEHAEDDGAPVDRGAVDRIIHQQITITGDNTNVATLGGAASSNTGQQQGVNVGRGSASVTEASQNAQPDDTFDAAAFEKELTEVLHMLVDRIEEIESTQLLEAQQVLTSLKKAELDTAKTLADVQTMLDDVWEESMKTKYGNLSKALQADGALAQALKLAPTLIALLSGTGAG